MEQDRNWLTEFPVKIVPESWPLNPIFLEKLGELQTLFALHGYELKLGSELEFGIDTLSDTMAAQVGYMHEGYERDGTPALAFLQESLLQEQMLVFEEKPFEQTLAHLRAYFKKDPDAKKLCRQVKMSVSDALRVVDDIEKRFRSDDRETKERAEQDIFLAFLHTTPFEQGGLRDIIEPRFGPHEFGLGWYDMKGPEIRTPIQNGAEGIIESYHKYLHVLYTQAPRFGFILNLTESSAPQLHVSIWRKRDNKNMMLMKDAESVDFCEKALRGYSHALRAQPFLIQDMDIHSDNFFMKSFSASTSRLSFIRQETDNWELRRYQHSGLTHIARQLTNLLGGMAYGLFHPHTQTPAFESDVKIERRQHPVVVHKHGAHISALRSTIEHCAIGEDGRLIPDTEIIKSNIERLAAEIGPQYLNGVEAEMPEADGRVYNLSHPVVWEQALSQIKYVGPGKLDLSAFKESSSRPFVAAVESLEIKGTRTAFHCDDVPLPTALYQVAEGISNAHKSDFVHDMYTPYEQSEIAFHYNRASEQALSDHAARVLRSHLYTLDEPPKTTKPMTPEDLLSYTIYREITMHALWGITADNSVRPFLQRIVNLEQPIQRTAFTGAESYSSSIRKKFKHAALGVIDWLEEGQYNKSLEWAETLVQACESKESHLDLAWGIVKNVEDLLTKHNVDQMMDKDKKCMKDMANHTEDFEKIIGAYFMVALHDPLMPTNKIKEELKSALLHLTDLPPAGPQEGDPDPSERPADMPPEPEMDPLSVKLYNESLEYSKMLVAILVGWMDKLLIDENPDQPHADMADREGIVKRRVEVMKQRLAQRPAEEPRDNFVIARIIE